MNKRLFLFAAIFATVFYLSCTEIPSELYNELSSSSGGSPNGSQYCAVTFMPGLGTCGRIGTCVESTECSYMGGTLVSESFCIDNDYEIDDCGYVPPTPSSSSAGNITPQLFCDYGPEHSFGGGCKPINNTGECDLVWGKVETSCGNPSDKMFCDFGAASYYGAGGCYEIENTTPAKVKCRDTDGGTPVTLCAANSTNSYCIDEDGDCARINCPWVEDLGGCFSEPLTRNRCLANGYIEDYNLYDCN